MLAKFLFLAIIPISMGSFDLNKLPTGEDEYGVTSEGARITYDLPFGEGRGTKPQRLQSPAISSSAASGEISTGEGLEKLRKNWRENLTQFDTLRKESEELSDMIKKLMMYKNSRMANFRNPRQLHNSFNALGRFNNRLARFKQVRLLEIGKTELKNMQCFNALGRFNNRLARLKQVRLLEIGKTELKNMQLGTKDKPTRKPKSNLPHIPAEIVEFIIKDSWEKNAVAMMNDLKKLLKNKKGFIRTTSDFTLSRLYTDVGKASLLCWQYALRLIDFFYQNDFITRSSLQSFYGDPDIITQVISYVKLSFVAEFRHWDFFVDSYLWTENWYWSHLHKSFEVLERRGKDLINAHVLLVGNHQKLVSDAKRKQFATPDYQNMRVFFNEFDNNWYLDQLKGRDISNRSSNSAEIVAHIIPQDDEGKRRITEDISRIVYIIGNGCQLMIGGERHLYNILDFIDRKISPGTVEKLFPVDGLSSLVHDTSWNFNKKRIVSKHKTAIEDLYLAAKNYYKYIKIQDPTHWSKSNTYKTTFNAFLPQMQLLEAQIRDESSRLLKLLGDTQSYRDLNLSLMAIQQEVARYQEDLRIKSNTFRLEPE